MCIQVKKNYHTLSQSVINDFSGYYQLAAFIFCIYKL